MFETAVQIWIILYGAIKLGQLQELQDGERPRSKLP